MPILRKYATTTTINFPLIGLGTVNFTSTASLTTADLKLSLDEGAFATVGTAIVNEGSYGYSYACTTADLTAARVMMVIVSTASPKECEDTMILIETYGHANAQHAFDFDTASVTVSGGTITSVTNSVTATVGTNNDKTGYSLTQAFPSNFADLSISATTGLVSISTASLVIAGTVSDKTGYSLTQTFPSNFADLSISATTGGVKLQPNQSVIASAGTVTLTGGQLVTVGTISAGAVSAGLLSAGAFAAGFLSAGGIAAGAISAGGIATDAIDADALAADAITEIWSKAMVAPTAVPAPTASALSALSWMYGLSVFKIDQTATLQTVYQSDGSTTLATSTVADNGTTFTKGSFN